MRRITAFGVVPTLALCVFTSSADAGFFEDRFIDPEDNHVDGSKWRLERKGGFLPVPIVITEPAV